MVAANARTHKDMSISRVPLALVRRIARDAKREQVSESAVMRRWLLKAYGMLPPEQKNGQ
jgi:hypothetical protein